MGKRTSEMGKECINGGGKIERGEKTGETRMGRGYTSVNS